MTIRVSDEHESILKKIALDFRLISNKMIQIWRKKLV